MTEDSSMSVKKTARDEIQSILAGRHHLDVHTLKVLQEIRTTRHLGDAQWQKLGSEFYERRLLQHHEDAYFTEFEPKFLEDLTKAFHLTQEAILGIRRIHAAEAMEKLPGLSFEDQHLSSEQKGELLQLGDIMGLTSEFVGAFLAAHARKHE